MRLGHIEIPSADPKRTADFYRNQLGFATEAVQDSKFFWLTKDGMTFLIRPKASEAEAHNLVFYSSAPDQDAHAVKQTGIDVKFETDNCHHFEDPNRYPLQIVDPAEDHSG